MKRRKLKNGQVVTDAPKSVQMTIDSKCPKKWAFVDMETGDIWVHKSRLKRKGLNGVFYQADSEAIESLLQITMPIALKKVAKDLAKLE